MKQSLLKKEVERILGHQLKEARDFEQLSHLLLSHTRERLSPTTLKRLWGYLKNEEVQTRPHTLDVLARFVGYRSYEDFYENASDTAEPQSDGLDRRYLAIARTVPFVYKTRYAAGAADIFPVRCRH